MYDWRRRQPFMRDPDPEQWRALLAKHYDMVLLSSLDMIKDEDLPQYWRDAQSYGYCGTLFSGFMIWKTYAPEDQAVIVFRRCAAEPRLRPTLTDLPHLRDH